MKPYHFNLFYDLNYPIDSYTRIGWDEYFLLIAASVSIRSTCKYYSSGAVIVKDNRIVSTGYNGNPKDKPHCLECGCALFDAGYDFNSHLELCTAVHAVQNAIISARSEDMINSKIYIVKYDKQKNEFIISDICVLCKNMCKNAKIKEYIIGDLNNKIIHKEI